MQEGNTAVKRELHVLLAGAEATYADRNGMVWLCHLCPRRHASPTYSCWPTKV